MRTLLLVVLLVVAGFSSGCATIVSGTSDAVSFNSYPQGAEVYVDGQIVGRTPCQASVGRGWGTGDVEMILGGEKRQTSVPRVMNGWYAGNLLFGGLVGLLVVDLPLGNVRKTPDGTTVYASFARGGAR